MSNSRDPHALERADDHTRIDSMHSPSELFALQPLLLAPAEHFYPELADLLRHLQPARPSHPHSRQGSSTGAHLPSTSHISQSSLSEMVEACLETSPLFADLLERVDKAEMALQSIHDGGNLTEHEGQELLNQFNPFLSHTNTHQVNPSDASYASVNSPLDKAGLPAFLPPALRDALGFETGKGGDRPGHGQSEVSLQSPLRLNSLRYCGDKHIALLCNDTRLLIVVNQASAESEIPHIAHTSYDFHDHQSIFSPSGALNAPDFHEPSHMIVLSADHIQQQQQQQCLGVPMHSRTVEVPASPPQIAPYTALFGPPRTLSFVLVEFLTLRGGRWRLREKSGSPPTGNHSESLRGSLASDIAWSTFAPISLPHHMDNSDNSCSLSPTSLTTPLNECRLILSADAALQDEETVRLFILLSDGTYFLYEFNNTSRQWYPLLTPFGDALTLAQQQGSRVALHAETSKTASTAMPCLPQTHEISAWINPYANQLEIAIDVRKHFQQYSVNLCRHLNRCIRTINIIRAQFNCLYEYLLLYASISSSTLTVTSPPSAEGYSDNMELSLASLVWIHIDTMLTQVSPEQLFNYYRIVVTILIQSGSGHHCAAQELIDGSDPTPARDVVSSHELITGVIPMCHLIVQSLQAIKQSMGRRTDLSPALASIPVEDVTGQPPVLQPHSELGDTPTTSPPRVDVASSSSSLALNLTEPIPLLPLVRLNPMGVSMPTLSREILHAGMVHQPPLASQIHNTEGAETDRSQDLHSQSPVDSVGRPLLLTSLESMVGILWAERWTLIPAQTADEMHRAPLVFFESDPIPKPLSHGMSHNPTATTDNLEVGTPTNYHVAGLAKTASGDAVRSDSFDGFMSDVDLIHSDIDADISEMVISPLDDPTTTTTTTGLALRGSMSASGIEGEGIPHGHQQAWHSHSASPFPHGVPIIALLTIADASTQLNAIQTRYVEYASYFFLGIDHFIDDLNDYKMSASVLHSEYSSIVDSDAFYSSQMTDESSFGQQRLTMTMLPLLSEFLSFIVDTVSATPPTPVSNEKAEPKRSTRRTDNKASHCDPERPGAMHSRTYPLITGFRCPSSTITMDLQRPIRNALNPKNFLGLGPVHMHCAAPARTSAIQEDGSRHDLETGDKHRDTLAEDIIAYLQSKLDQSIGYGDDSGDDSSKNSKEPPSPHESRLLLQASSPQHTTSTQQFLPPISTPITLSQTYSSSYLDVEFSTKLSDSRFYNAAPSLTLAPEYKEQYHGMYDEPTLQRIHAVAFDMVMQQLYERLNTLTEANHHQRVPPAMRAEKDSPFQSISFQCESPTALADALMAIVNPSIPPGQATEHRVSESTGVHGTTQDAPTQGGHQYLSSTNGAHSCDVSAINLTTIDSMKRFPQGISIELSHTLHIDQYIIHHHHITVNCHLSDSNKTIPVTVKLPIVVGAHAEGGNRITLSGSKYLANIMPSIDRTHSPVSPLHHHHSSSVDLQQRQHGASVPLFIKDVCYLSASELFIDHLSQLAAHTTQHTSLSLTNGIALSYHALMLASTAPSQTHGNSRAPSDNLNSNDILTHIITPIFIQSKLQLSSLLHNTHTAMGASLFLSEILQHRCDDGQQPPAGIRTLQSSLLIPVREGLSDIGKASAPLLGGYRDAGQQSLSLSSSSSHISHEFLDDLPVLDCDDIEMELNLGLDQLSVGGGATYQSGHAGRSLGSPYHSPFGETSQDLHDTQQKQTKTEHSHQKQYQTITCSLQTNLACPPPLLICPNLHVKTPAQRSSALSPPVYHATTGMNTEAILHYLYHTNIKHPAVQRLYDGFSPSSYNDTLFLQTSHIYTVLNELSCISTAEIHVNPTISTIDLITNENKIIRITEMPAWERESEVLPEISPFETKPKTMAPTVPPQLDHCLTAMDFVWKGTGRVRCSPGEQPSLHARQESPHQHPGLFSVEVDGQHEGQHEGSNVDVEITPGTVGIPIELEDAGRDKAMEKTAKRTRRFFSKAKRLIKDVTKNAMNDAMREEIGNSTRAETNPDDHDQDADKFMKLLLEDDKSEQHGTQTDQIIHKDTGRDANADTMADGKEDQDVPNPHDLTFTTYDSYDPTHAADHGNIYGRSQKTNSGFEAAAHVVSTLLRPPHADTTTLAVHNPGLIAKPFPTSDLSHRHLAGRTHSKSSLLHESHNSINEDHSPPAHSAFQQLWTRFPGAMFSLHFPTLFRLEYLYDAFLTITNQLPVEDLFVTLSSKAMSVFETFKTTPPTQRRISGHPRVMASKRCTSQDEPITPLLMSWRRYGTRLHVEREVPIARFDLQRTQLHEVFSDSIEEYFGYTTIIEDYDKMHGNTHIQSSSQLMTLLPHTPPGHSSTFPTDQTRVHPYGYDGDRDEIGHAPHTPNNRHSPRHAYSRDSLTCDPQSTALVSTPGVPFGKRHGSFGSLPYPLTTSLTHTTTTNRSVVSRIRNRKAVAWFLSLQRAYGYGSHPGSIANGNNTAGPRPQPQAGPTAVGHLRSNYFPQHEVVPRGHPIHQSLEDYGAVYNQHVESCLPSPAAQQCTRLPDIPGYASNTVQCRQTSVAVPVQFFHPVSAKLTTQSHQQPGPSSHGIVTSPRIFTTSTHMYVISPLTYDMLLSCPIFAFPHAQDCLYPGPPAEASVGTGDRLSLRIPLVNLWWRYAVLYAYNYIYGDDDDDYGRGLESSDSGNLFSIDNHPNHGMHDAHLAIDEVDQVIRSVKLQELYHSYYSNVYGEDAESAPQSHLESDGNPQTRVAHHGKSTVKPSFKQFQWASQNTMAAPLLSPLSFLAPIDADGKPQIPAILKDVVVLSIFSLSTGSLLHRSILNGSSPQDLNHLPSYHSYATKCIPKRQISLAQPVASMHGDSGDNAAMGQPESLCRSHSSIHPFHSHTTCVRVTPHHELHLQRRLGDGTPLTIAPLDDDSAAKVAPAREAEWMSHRGPGGNTYHYSAAHENDTSFTVIHHSIKLLSTSKGLRSSSQTRERIHTILSGLLRIKPRLQSQYQLLLVTELYSIAIAYVRGSLVNALKHTYVTSAPTSGEPCEGPFALLQRTILIMLSTLYTYYPALLQLSANPHPHSHHGTGPRRTTKDNRQMTRLQQVYHQIAPFPCALHSILMFALHYGQDMADSSFVPELFPELYPLMLTPPPVQSGGEHSRRAPLQQSRFNDASVNGNDDTTSLPPIDIPSTHLFDLLLIILHLFITKAPPSIGSVLDSANAAHSNSDLCGVSKDKDVSDIMLYQLTYPMAHHVVPLIQKSHALYSSPLAVQFARRMLPLVNLSLVASYHTSLAQRQTVYDAMQYAIDYISSAAPLSPSPPSTSNRGGDEDVDLSRIKQFVADETLYKHRIDDIIPSPIQRAVLSDVIMIMCRLAQKYLSDKSTPTQNAPNTDETSGTTSSRRSSRSVTSSSSSLILPSEHWANILLIKFYLALPGSMSASKTLSNPHTTSGRSSGDSTAIDHRTSQTRTAPPQQQQQPVSPQSPSTEQPIQLQLWIKSLQQGIKKHPLNQYSSESLSSLLLSDISLADRFLTHVGIPRSTLEDCNSDTFARYKALAGEIPSSVDVLSPLSSLLEGSRDNSSLHNHSSYSMQYMSLPFPLFLSTFVISSSTAQDTFRREQIYSTCQLLHLPCNVVNLDFPYLTHHLHPFSMFGTSFFEATNPQHHHQLQQPQPAHVAEPTSITWGVPHTLTLDGVRDDPSEARNPYQFLHTLLVVVNHHYPHLTRVLMAVTLWLQHEFQKIFIAREQIRNIQVCHSWASFQSVVKSHQEQYLLSEESNLMNTLVELNTVASTELPNQNLQPHLPTLALSRTSTTMGRQRHGRTSIALGTDSQQTDNPQHSPSNDHYLVYVDPWLSQLASVTTTVVSSNVEGEQEMNPPQVTTENNHEPAARYQQSMPTTGSIPPLHLSGHPDSKHPHGSSTSDRQTTSAPASLQLGISVMPPPHDDKRYKQPQDTVRTIIRNYQLQMSGRSLSSNHYHPDNPQQPQPLPVKILKHSTFALIQKEFRLMLITRSELRRFILCVNSLDQIFRQSDNVLERMLSPSTFLSWPSMDWDVGPKEALHAESEQEYHLFMKYHYKSPQFVKTTSNVTLHNTTSLARSSKAGANAPDDVDDNPFPKTRSFRPSSLSDDDHDVPDRNDSDDGEHDHDIDDRDAIWANTPTMPGGPQALHHLGTSPHPPSSLGHLGASLKVSYGSKDDQSEIVKRLHDDFDDDDVYKMSRIEVPFGPTHTHSDSRHGRGKRDGLLMTGRFQYDVQQINEMIRSSNEYNVLHSAAQSHHHSYYTLLETPSMLAAQRNILYTMNAKKNQVHPSLQRHLLSFLTQIPIHIPPTVPLLGRTGLRGDHLSPSSFHAVAETPSGLRLTADHCLFGYISQIVHEFVLMHANTHPTGDNGGVGNVEYFASALHSCSAALLSPTTSLLGDHFKRITSLSGSLLTNGMITTLIELLAVNALTVRNHYMATCGTVATLLLQNPAMVSDGATDGGLAPHPGLSSPPHLFTLAALSHLYNRTFDENHTQSSTSMPWLLQLRISTLKQYILLSIIQQYESLMVYFTYFFTSYQLHSLPLMILNNNLTVHRGRILNLIQTMSATILDDIVLPTTTDAGTQQAPAKPNRTSAPGTRGKRSPGVKPDDDGPRPDVDEDTDQMAAMVSRRTALNVVQSPQHPTQSRKSFLPSLTSFALFTSPAHATSAKHATESSIGSLGQAQGRSSPSSPNSRARQQQQQQPPGSLTPQSHGSNPPGLNSHLIRKSHEPIALSQQQRLIVDLIINLLPYQPIEMDLEDSTMAWYTHGVEQDYTTGQSLPQGMSIRETIPFTTKTPSTAPWLLVHADESNTAVAVPALHQQPPATDDIAKRMEVSSQIIRQLVQQTSTPSHADADIGTTTATAEPTNVLGLGIAHLMMSITNPVPHSNLQGTQCERSVPLSLIPIEYYGSVLQRPPLVPSTHGGRPAYHNGITHAITVVHHRIVEILRQYLLLACKRLSQCQGEEREPIFSGYKGSLNGDTAELHSQSRLNSISVLPFSSPLLQVPSSLVNHGIEATPKRSFTSLRQMDFIMTLLAYTKSS